MNVLFLAPETSVYNLRFVDALKRAGARVMGVGHAPRQRLSPELARRLDDYRTARRLLDVDEVVGLARGFASVTTFDRVETIDEPAVVAAAQVREALAAPGLTPSQARVCRDKAEMKEVLRQAGIPVAASAAATSPAEVQAFVDREGWPVVVKPIEGFGSLDTYRCGTQAELDHALDGLKPSPTRRIIVEEFVEGHEGFYDTIVAHGAVAHDFVGHYFPGCLEATRDRRVCPTVVCSNQLEGESYRELREMGARVVSALGLRNTATHMEWFFGPKGLKVSEIGARPAGERIWDMHAVGNEFDLYGAWAAAVLRGQVVGKPSRRYSTGSVQIRPDHDGKYVGHSGVELVQKKLGTAIFESAIPKPGTPVQPIEKGWHVNTWFRVKDLNDQQLQAKLAFIARTVKALAK